MLTSVCGGSASGREVVPEQVHHRRLVDAELGVRCRVSRLTSPSRREIDSTWSLIRPACWRGSPAWRG